MGKMKEEFLNDREKDIIQEAIDAFMDDDYQLEEYYASMKPEDCCGGSCHCEGEPATQEEVQAQHDAWWNSLTEEQKQKLYEEAERAEEERIERELDDLASFNRWNNNELETE